VKHSWLKPRFQKWQRADHKFALASMVLIIFMFVAGLTNWLLSGNQGGAAAGASGKAIITTR